MNTNGHEFVLMRVYSWLKNFSFLSPHPPSPKASARQAPLSPARGEGFSPFGDMDYPDRPGNDGVGFFILSANHLRRGVERRSARGNGLMDTAFRRTVLGGEGGSLCPFSEVRGQFSGIRDKGGG
jgi:hypothetical protein